MAEGILDPSPRAAGPPARGPRDRGSALYVAHAADPVAARHEISECNDRFLAGLGVRRPADG